MTTPTEDPDLRLRQRLHELASTAPVLDPHGKATRRHPGQPLLAFAAVTLLGAGVATAAVFAVSAMVGGESGDGPEASCAREVTYADATYAPLAGIVRMPVSGADLPGTARSGGCDDGNGVTAVEEFPVQSIRGGGSAVLAADGDLWVRVGSVLPDALSEVLSAVPCESLPGALNLEGTVTSIESAQESRFDGDVRAPYELELRTVDPRLTQGAYQWVTVQAQGGVGSEPDAETVRRAVWNGEPAAATFECEAGRFTVLSLSR